MAQYRLLRIKKLKKFWTSIVAVLLVTAATCASATAATFDYVGKLYQYNTDPADYGTNLTGFVTFSCNPCSDGTYYFNNATVTAYDFVSGSLSITKTTDVNAADSYIILSGGSVSQWDINVID